MFHAAGVDTDSDVRVTVHDPVLVTDLDHQRVEVDDGVERAVSSDRCELIVSPIVS